MRGIPAGYTTPYYPGCVYASLYIPHPYPPWVYHPTHSVTVSAPVGLLVLPCCGERALGSNLGIVRGYEAQRIFLSSKV